VHSELPEDNRDPASGATQCPGGVDLRSWAEWSKNTGRVESWRDRQLESDQNRWALTARCPRAAGKARHQLHGLGGLQGLSGSGFTLAAFGEAWRASISGEAGLRDRAFEDATAGSCQGEYISTAIACLLG